MQRDLIIDTHCHYNLDPLFSDGQTKEVSSDTTMIAGLAAVYAPRPEEKRRVGRPSKQIQPPPRQFDNSLPLTWQKHWQKAQNFGVTRSIVVGTAEDTSHRALKIANQEKNLYAAIGLHPGEVQSWVQKKLTENPSYRYQLYLQQDSDVLTWWVPLLLPQQKKVVAIGECGLDYFRLPENPKTQKMIRELQKMVLREHLRLANQFKLPIILHVRDTQLPESPTPDTAYWDTLALLQENQPQAGFVLHCVSGPKTYVKACLELGGYIGVAGNYTYASAQAIRELVALAPKNRILLETDAPFLPPKTFRGKPCEPWMITETADTLYQIAGLNPETVLASSISLFAIK